MPPSGGTVMSRANFGVEKQPHLGCAAVQPAGVCTKHPTQTQRASRAGCGHWKCLAYKHLMQTLNFAVSRITWSSSAKLQWHHSSLGKKGTGW